MDHRSYIKPARCLTAQDRNIENNDHSSVYRGLKIEWRREVLAKSKLRALVCVTHQSRASLLLQRLIEAALSADEKMFPVSHNE